MFSPKDHADAYKRALTCYQRGAWDQAIVFFRRCWTMRPEASVAHALALCHWQKTENAESRRWAEEALKLNPAYAQSHALLGTMAADLGDAETAVRHHGLAWQHGRITQSAYALARESAFPTDDVLANDILTAPTGNFSGRDRVRLLFAQAEILRRRGQMKQAYALFNQANRVLARELPYDRRAEETRVALREEQARQALARGDVFAAPDEKDQYPWVFVLGLPRCGSTIAERMLATQAGVCPMGESPAIPQAAFLLNRQSPEFHELAQTIQPVSGPLAELIRETVLTCYGSGVAKDEILVDKQLWNVVHMGWLLQAFPGARVLWLTRHPGDQFVSNYTILYGDERRFNHSPTAFAHAWSMYQRWMGVWKSLFGDRIISIRFEDLLRAPVKTLEPVCSALGLPGGESLLSFHKVSGPVTSASQSQVRQALNQKGIGRWEKEKSYIDGDLTELETLIEAYDSTI